MLGTSKLRGPSVAGACIGLLALLASGLPAAEPAAAGDAPELAPIEVGKPERIEVYPTEMKLGSPRQQMRMIVTGHYADNQLQDLTRAVGWSSSDDQVVQVKDGIAVPAGDGRAQIALHVGGHSVTVPVEVTGFDSSDPVSFHYETLAALTKQGCNSGACHGSPSGKGGFRLSLLAYDLALDQLTLVREAYGRRTNVAEPETSLMLVKPTMQISHGGGLRLHKRDPAYKLLKSWIGEGCRVDADDAPQCVRLEVYPPSGRVLKRPAHTQRLLVRAHFSNGTVRDVTSIAKYSSSDEAVASANADGLVVGHDRGQAAIMVRYLEKVETCNLTFVKDIPGFVWNDPPEFNYVDQLVHKKLRQLQYRPSELCTDEEFVRRVYLDVIGVLPTVSEVAAFLSDTSEKKRAALIDALLARPDFATFWALKWGDLLRLKGQAVTASGVRKYYQWLVQSIAENRPVDVFCRDLLTASGSTYTNPPANYYRTASDTNDCTETTAQLFLGVRIQCAKCHNHPFERWTQDNYYGMAAFFNRVQRKDSRREGELVVWMARSGEVNQPRTGQQMKPWLPLAGDVADSGDQDRRHILAAWLTQPDNPFFARVAANRIWSQVMGRGIVEPVDDFRDSNPPSNGELLDALSQDFVNSNFDRKHILRAILNSHTYQRSSRTNEFNRDEEKLFSHAQVRLLSAEQLLDAICHLTGVSEEFKGLPPGTRATQLPSPDVNHEFLKVFGQPERQTACACERTTDSNLSQALQLFNGPLVHGKIGNENNRFRKMVAAEKPDEEIVDQLYLAGLSRHAAEEEIQVAKKHIESKDDRIKALEDVCWAILNTNEFLFQH